MTPYALIVYPPPEMQLKHIIKSVLPLTLLIAVAPVCEASSITCDQAFSMVKKQTHPVIIDRAIFILHRHIADHGVIPDISRKRGQGAPEFQKVLGVSSMKFYGQGAYVWNIWRYHDSRIDALTQVLQKLDHNLALTSSERERVKDFMQKKLSDAQVVKDDNDASILLLHRFIADHARVPSTITKVGQKSEFSELLGYTYHKFVGQGSWHPGNSRTEEGINAIHRLNDSRDDAFTKALNRVESNEALSPEEKNTVSYILEQQLLYGAHAGLPPDPNIKIQENNDTIVWLHRFIADFGRWPNRSARYTISTLSLEAEFNDNKFFGRGPYSPGSSAAYLALNESPQEAFARTLEAVNTSAHLSEKERQLVASLLQFKIQTGLSGDFSTRQAETPLWIVKQNELANRRLHRFIADTGAVPDLDAPIFSRSRFSNVVEMAENGYFGLKRFAINEKFAALRLNDSVLDAFKECLRQVDNNSSLSETEKLVVKKVLVEKIESLTR